MIPIHLEWQRPLDGADLIKNDDGELLIAAKSERFAPISYRSADLENPVAIALLNADTEEKLISFVSRFGIPHRYPAVIGGQDNNQSIPLSLILAIREEIWDLLSTPIDQSRTMEWVSAANKLLTYTNLSPTFEHSETEARHRLVFRPHTLGDLMALECAIAFNVGATMTRCAHCQKAFLVGPLTGRRSHATYCSDRCRVAAMRARNAAKGGK